MSALGYYIPGEQQRIDIQFLPKLEGYIWIFPRCGHLSAGICGKGEPAPELRKRLERYLLERGISWKDAAFYSHLLPSLDTQSWRGNRVAGAGWMAVGDAAGLVDPITGEGLYYAIRSGDLLRERQACWLDYRFFRSPQTRKPHDSSQAALSDLRMNAAEKVCHT